MLPLARAAALGFAAALFPGAAFGIAFTPFGPAGEGGAVNGQTLTIGAGGSLEELDAFVAVAGQDLNGATAGSAAQLSRDALPAGLSVTLGTALLNGDTDLALTWTVSNQGAASLGALTFLTFFDFEIDETVNTFFNEYAVTSGAPAAGIGFEVDEPGYSFGDIFDHLRAGVLDGTNALPVGSPDDVSFAFSFTVPTLGAGASALFRVLLSEDGDAIAPFTIEQRDGDPASSGTRILASAAIVPEPGTGLLLAAGLAALAARRGGRG